VSGALFDEAALPSLNDLRAVFLGIEGVLCPPRWTLLKQSLLAALEAGRHAVGERALERAAAALERQPRRGGKGMDRYGADWVRALLRRLGLADADQPDIFALPTAYTPDDLYPDVMPFLGVLRTRAIARVVIAFPGDPSPHEVTRLLDIGDQCDLLVVTEDDDRDEMSARGALLTALEVCHIRPEQAALVSAQPRPLTEAKACRIHPVRIAREEPNVPALRTLEALVPEELRAAVAESGLL